MVKNITKKQFLKINKNFNTSTSFCGSDCNHWFDHCRCVGLCDIGWCGLWWAVIELLVVLLGGRCCPYWAAEDEGESRASRHTRNAQLVLGQSQWVFSKANKAIRSWLCVYLERSTLIKQTDCSKYIFLIVKLVQSLSAYNFGWF